jgi:hypothetical protein
MKTITQTIATALILTALAGTHGADQDAEGFRPLFNGKDLTGWKLRNPSGQPSWSVQDGLLVNDVSGGRHGTDLITEGTLQDFVLRFEYKVPKGANSGVYLRGRYEIQILDDYDRGQPSKGGNCAIYSQAAVAKFASKPAGQWQTVEATIVGNKISVILNGVKVHDQFECKTPTGGQLDNNVDQPGPVMLQGDHGSVTFRNIRIKELKRPAA